MARGAIGRRLALAAAFAAAGVAAAIWVPNTLNWKSDSPYLDTVTGVVNYREGSGHGRIVQYTTSLKLAAAHPLLGVGPGNWAVAYPRVAARGDPSIDHDDGMTSNPWPSSDWIAMLAERGIPASIALALALLGLAVIGARRDARSLEPRGFPGAARALAHARGDGGGRLLRRLAPARAAHPVRVGVPRRARDAGRHAYVDSDLHCHGPGLLTVGGAVVIALALALHSIAQLGSMAMFTSATTTGAYVRASMADPGSYRIQLRVAQIGAERGRCDLVRRYGMRAHELFPAAPEPVRMLAPCGVRLKRR